MIKRSYLFFFSTAMSIISALLLLIGCTVYTVAVKKSQIINDFTIQSQSTGEDTPLGLVVSVGEGIYLIWAAFVLTFVSVIPYMLRCVSLPSCCRPVLTQLFSCCTYRG